MAGTPSHTAFPPGDTKRKPGSKKRKLDISLEEDNEIVITDVSDIASGEVRKPRLAELEDMIQAHLGTGKFFIVAAALREIDNDKLYHPGHKSIYSYAKARYQFSRRTTNTYLCSAAVYESLVEDRTLPIPCSISHIRSLHKFKADIRRAIWSSICSSGCNITEETVMSMIVKYETGIAFSDLGNEIYVPQEVINVAKLVIDKPEFDLDPASCPFANSVHGCPIANHFYDEATNGLIQKWYGDCWLFPPYGSDGDGVGRQVMWFETAERKFREGEISSCHVLLKLTNSTSTPVSQNNNGNMGNNISSNGSVMGSMTDLSNSSHSWMHYPWCLLTCKLTFLTPTNKEKCAQDESYVVVYLGVNPERFCREFSQIGMIPGFNSWSFQYPVPCSLSNIPSSRTLALS